VRGNMDTLNEQEGTTPQQPAAAEIESSDKGSRRSADEQYSPSGKQDPNQDVQLTTQETSTAIAQKSGGPRTQQGKENSKHNATTHGIFSKVVVINGESRAEFEDLLIGLRNCLQPEGMLEEILVEKLAALFWRERRLIIADGKASFETGIELFDLYKRPDLDHLVRYETTLDRAIDRALAQLERFQRIRLGQPVPPRIEVNLSSS
jgi:hypothetical protein